MHQTYAKLKLRQGSGFSEALTSDATEPTLTCENEFNDEYTLSL